MRWMWITLLALAACDDSTPVCAPRSVASCYCNTGDPGQKVCSADGLYYLACTCLPDAGVDAAASPRSR